MNICSALITVYIRFIQNVFSETFIVHPRFRRMYLLCAYKMMYPKDVYGLGERWHSILTFRTELRGMKNKITEGFNIIVQPSI